MARDLGVSCPELVYEKKDPMQVSKAQECETMDPMQVSKAQEYETMDPR